MVLLLALALLFTAAAGKKNKNQTPNTQCTLPAQHQTKDRRSKHLAEEHSVTFFSFKARYFFQQLVGPNQS